MTAADEVIKLGNEIVKIGNEIMRIAQQTENEPATPEEIETLNKFKEIIKEKNEQLDKIMEKFQNEVS